jgi:REP element-mobilizing transposase RayT
VIKGPVQEKVWTLIGDVARSYGVDVMEVSGSEDHVHMLVNLPPKIALATLPSKARCCG